MSIFSKRQSASGETTGTIVGVSAVAVNNMHLPVAEYEVNGAKYKVRVPYDIAVRLEAQSGI